MIDLLFQIQMIANLKIGINQNIYLIQMLQNQKTGMMKWMESGKLL
jgi:hypothetical protein